MVESRKKERLHFETYAPKDRMGLGREQTLTLLGYLGLKISHFGGALGNAALGILTSIKALSAAKGKVKEHQMKNWKILDLNNKKKIGKA